MGFAEQAALADDETFRSKVRVALMTAAIDVMGEAVGSHTATEYAKRQNLAHDILRAAGSSMHLEAFAWAVAANPAVTGSSNDGDIQFSVNAVFGDMAGIRETD